MGVGRLGIGRVGIWVQLSAGIGPDGMAMDVEGRVAVAHPGTGAVWLFSRSGEPIVRIGACERMRVSKVAYGGSDRKTLFMTEADSGAVLAADLDVPGCPMYSRVD